MGVGLSCNLHKKPKVKDCQKTGIVTCRQMYPGVRTTCEKGWMQFTGCGLTTGTLDERSLFLPASYSSLLLRVKVIPFEVI